MKGTVTGITNNRPRLTVKVGWAALLLTAVLLAGCNRARVPFNPDDYVEIDNPITDGNPENSGKIWVPKSSVERGVPRGRDLVRKGYEAVTGGPGAGSVAAAPRPDHVRLRLLIAGDGSGTVGKQLRDILSHSCAVRPVGGPAPPAAATEQERQAFLGALAAQPGSGPVLLVSTPEGSKAGAAIKADLHDSRGPVLLRALTVRIPTPEKDEPMDEAVQRALSGLAGAIQEVLNRAPWYGRVVSVSSERIYVDAGAESGLKPGQRLIVYRGGEVVKGLGFAPGTKITAFAITDYVGPDGAYGTASEAAKVLPGDFVELEK